MEKLKKFEEFVNDSVTYDSYDMVNEEFLTEKIEDIVEWFKEKVNKGEVKKGEKNERAKQFNISDFTRFVKSILPSYTNLKEKKQKQDFLKKIDGYIEPFTGILGVATFLFFFSDQFKDFMLNSIGTTGVLTAYGVVFLGRLFNGICQNSVNDFNDVEIEIRRDGMDKEKKVIVDFKFYYSIGVKNTYRILHNSFVRLIQKYEDKDWAGIEWGHDSYLKDTEGGKSSPARYGQHLIKMDFYPQEFADLLYDTTYGIYEDRLEYAKEQDKEVKNEWEDDIDRRKIILSFGLHEKKGYGDIRFTEDKGSVNMEMYVQRMSNKQIIDLAKKIDGLELKYHRPMERKYRRETRDE